MALNLSEIIKEASISYPHTIKERDSVRIAVFLRDFIRALRLKSILLTQKQAILTIDEDFRAQLPANYDPNGKMIISVCVCDQLYTIDIQNNSCPTNVKKPCTCEDPVPCDQEIGSLCGCKSCGNQIGYVYDYSFGTNWFGYWWNNQWYYPMGRVNAQNPYGNAHIEGDTVLFSSDLRECEVYILYEELQSVETIEIAEDWRLAAIYYVLMRLWQDLNPNQARGFERLYKEQVFEKKQTMYRSKINWDTFNRVTTSKKGLIKFQ